MLHSFSLQNTLPKSVRVSSFTAATVDPAISSLDIEGCEIFGEQAELVLLISHFFWGHKVTERADGRSVRSVYNKVKCGLSYKFGYVGKAGNLSSVVVERTSIVNGAAVFVGGGSEVGYR